MDDLSPIGLAIRELEWIEVGRLDHDTLYPSYSQVLWNVRWNEDAMNLLQVSWQTSCCGLGDRGGVLDSQPCNFLAIDSRMSCTAWRWTIRGVQSGNEETRSYRG